MGVEIVGDPAKLLEPTTHDIVITQVSNYVSTFKRIKDAAAHGEPLRVIVQNPTCAAWLERMAQSYHDTMVRYSQTSPRELLAEKWQTELPEEVGDDAIIASGFLKADIVPRTGQSYEQIILEYYWGDFFTFDRFPVSLAGDLVENIDLTQWEQNQKLPLAMQALKTRGTRWLQQSKDARTRTLIEAVFDDPSTLKRQIAIYKLLKNYPSELGLAALGDWYTLFKELGLEPALITLEGQDVSDAIQEIRYYLNRLAAQMTSTADLLIVLDQMSGWLVEEFDWVDHLLEAEVSRINLTPEVLNRISTLFIPIHPLVEDRLMALEATIPPNYPTDPSHNETIEEWLNWAVDSYLPYHFWLEENNRFDDVLSGYSTAYSDWFYANYVDHKYQAQDRWVFNTLNPALASIRKGRKVLFIVIDNFNFKFLGRLLQLFAEHNFRVTEAVNPIWSLIPTATEVSKWSLVAGESDLNSIQGSNYQAILDLDWKGHFAGYKVAYLPKIGSLKERREFSENLLLLNYLPIDTVLHKDEDQIGSTHREEIQGYLETLVQEVVRFAKRARAEKDLDVYIVSDHGSTKIPAAIDNTLDDAFYRKQAKDKHHRYISVPPERLENPTAYDKEHCYIVRSDYVGTRENYFIARGYDRFIRTNESIYVHGGLTPEETIVPFCKLAKTIVTTLQPTVKLPENTVRVAVKSALVFVIGNPNEEKISNVELRIRESDLPGVIIDEIPQGLTIESSVPARFKRRPGTKVLEIITVEGSFEHQGKRHDITPVQILIEVKTLMDNTTDFDFGF